MNSDNPRVDRPPADFEGVPKIPDVIECEDCHQSFRLDGEVSVCQTQGEFNGQLQRRILCRPCLESFLASAELSPTHTYYTTSLNKVWQIQQDGEPAV